MEKTETTPKAAGAPAAKPEIKPFKPKKKRKWIKRVMILAVVAAVAVLAVWKLNNTGQQVLSASYIPVPATVQDITVSVSSTGTVQPIDSYKVTALVKGEILDAPFEEGATVKEGDLLYQIDAKDVHNSIERAELSLEQARLSYNELLKNKGDSQKNLDIKASATGVIQEVYYKVGDTVAAGTVLADILDRDNMLLTVPFHAVDAAGFSLGQTASVFVDGAFEPVQGVVDSIAVSESAGQGGTLVREVTIKVQNPGTLSDTSTGTASIGMADCAASGPFKYAAQKTLTAKATGEIASLSIAEGDHVDEDQIVGRFKATDMDTQIENARLSIQSAELSLQATRDQLENYTITSPISGTVIEKNFKAGDNLETGAGYLAVVFDMSTLTFDMSVDELYISKVKLGQTVEITADAVEGQVFQGHVETININGATMGGVTSYPVTVVIDQGDGALLPGMNVSADILVEHAENVLRIPVGAVQRGNTVLLAGPDAFDKNGGLLPEKLVETPVELGRNDDDYIEVLSGVSEGDTVVIVNSASSIYEMMGMAMGGPAMSIG